MNDAKIPAPATVSAVDDEADREDKISRVTVARHYLRTNNIRSIDREVVMARLVAEGVHTSERDVRDADLMEYAYRQGLRDAATANTVLAGTAQEKLDAAMRLYQRKLDLEYEQRVQDTVRRRLDEVLPKLHKREQDAKKIVQSRRGIIPASMFRKILACLHPDSVQDDERKPRYEEAFRLFNDHKLVLLSEKDDPSPIGSIPRTTAEMAAAKQRVQAEWRAHRAAKQASGNAVRRR